MQDIEYVALELSTKNHVTLAYKPDDDYISEIEPLFNREFKIVLTSFGEYDEDGIIKNQGFFVELPNMLKPFFKGVKPHTTTLVVNGGRAVNTYKMRVLYKCNHVVKGILKPYFKGQH